MVLFEKAGAENTDAVLRLVRERGEALGIGTCLVATTRGRTAIKALKILGGFRLVAVTHCTGFSEANFQELAAEERSRLEQAGVAVLTTTHAFGGVGRAVRKRFGTYQLDELVAQTLRLFGQGTKVAVEIALMAADAGLIPAGEPVISVGGTSEGADTALVLVPANTHKLFDLKVREVLCKPASW
jgi:hypothetical protein